MVSLLDGKLDRTGFGAPLVGLAARGWFQVHGPGGGGGAGRAGSRPCTGRRLRGRGETGFMPAFKEVDAEARRRGLTRPRLSGRRIGLPCLLLFGLAGTAPAAVAAAHQHYWLAWAAGLCLAGCGARHRRRHQPAPHRGRAGGAEAVAFGLWPRRPATARSSRLCGRPRRAARRAGGLRPGPARNGRAGQGTWSAWSWRAPWPASWSSWRAGRRAAALRRVRRPGDQAVDGHG